MKYKNKWMIDHRFVNHIAKCRSLLGAWIFFFSDIPQTQKYQSIFNNRTSLNSERLINVKDYQNICYSFHFKAPHFCSILLWRDRGFFMIK
jgi:hypothetical protein